MRKKEDEFNHQLLIVQQAYIQKKRKAIIVLEGVDAAGKGSLIRRLAWSMDPRALKVWPIGAPNAIEKEQHYLARFWSKLPSPGEIAVFDRSWYGRVLVEKIEKISDPKTVERAYREINEFEELQIDDDTRIVKLLLKITKKEQAKRFCERLNDPEKNWKLTFEDVRNRDKWNDYEKAYRKMILKTSKKHAKWKIIESDDKAQAREKAMDYIIKTLSEGISLKPQTVSSDLKKVIKRMENQY